MLPVPALFYQQSPRFLSLLQCVTSFLPYSFLT